MKTTLTALTILITLYSCRTKMENKHLALLKGDWQLNEADDEKGDWSSVFSFEDSICSINRCYSYTKFQLNEDTLTIFAEAKFFYSLEESKRFIIISVNKDILLLKIFSGFEKNDDTLSLTKMKPKNNFTPDEIYYVMTGGRGRSSGTMINIDSVGNFYYYGSYKNSDDKGYYGRLSTNLYRQLLNKIQQLPLGSLKPFYGSYDYDDVETGTCFKQRNKTVTSVTAGGSNEPLEFRLFSNYIFRLVERVKLESDTSVNEKFFSSKVEVQKIYMGIDSLSNNFFKKLHEENTALIKTMKKNLRKIKNKKLRELKRQEIALWEMSLRK